MLSTKTLTGRAINYARSLQLEVDCVDFIETKAIKPAGLRKADAVVFTSGNAIKYMPVDFALPPNSRVFSLSGKTMDALTEKGISVENVADNASELAEFLIAKGDIKSVVHICGNLKLDTLEVKLKNKGIAYYPYVVYETILLNKKVNVDDYNAIMFYSPSGVKSFFANNKLNNDIVVCCIGETTLDALKKMHPSIKTFRPLQPSSHSMLESIAEYFKATKKNEPTKA